MSAHKFLYQPIKPYRVNQHYGENNVCLSTDGKNRVINCDGNNPPAGFRSIYGPSGHLGIDMMARHGQEVFCAFTGVIDHIDTDPRSGLDVRIKSKIGSKTYIHIYEHLLGYQGQVGDAVLTGQLIGWADNTGYSSGDHLHFELQELKGNKCVSIDPAPYMYNIFARDHLKTESGLKWAAELIASIADNLAYYLRQAGKGSLKK